MDTKNIAVVQKCYSDFGKGDVEGVLSALTEDVKWIDPGYPDIPYAGKRSGKNEVAAFFKEMNETNRVHALRTENIQR